MGADPAHFVALDGDLETLGRSLAPTTIQIGRTLLSGLGGGYRPENGYRAVVEDLVTVTKELEGADLYDDRLTGHARNPLDVSCTRRTQWGTPNYDTIVRSR